MIVDHCFFLELEGAGADDDDDENDIDKIMKRDIEANSDGNLLARRLF